MSEQRIFAFVGRESEQDPQYPQCRKRIKKAGDGKYHSLCKG
jgi:hypothetical protein